MTHTQQIARRYYDAWTSGDRTIRVVEQLTVRNGMIASSVFVTDMVTFASFVGSERTDRA